MTIGAVRRSSGRPGKELFFPVLAVCIGAITLYAGLRQTMECLRIQHGAAARATVASSTPTERRGRHGTTYGIAVVFTFEHRGQRHSGHRVGVAGYSTSSRAERDDLMRGLRPGSSVTAFFEPNHPERAVLDPRLSTGIAMLTTAGAGVLSVGLVLPFLLPVRRYIRPDLPINTEPVVFAEGDDGFRILPRDQHSGFLTAIVFSIIAVQGLAYFLFAHRGAVPAGMIAGAGIASLFVAIGGGVATRMASPHGCGSIEIHPASSALVLRPLLKGRAAETIPMDRITDVKRTLRSQKYARRDTDKNAAFYPTLELITPQSATDTRKLKRFSFHRNNADELIGWLREQLALEVRDPGFEVVS